MIMYEEIFRIGYVCEISYILQLIP